MSKATYNELREQYANAEKYWLFSALSPEEVLESKRNFVSMYYDTIRDIYEDIRQYAMGVNFNREAFIARMDREGMTELLKDFRAFKDPEDHVLDFLEDGDELDPKYKKALKEGCQAVEARMAKDDILRGKAAEFQRWMIRNCDKSGGAGAEYRGAGGSVRPFAENFISQPPKDQLKAMYILENKLRHSNEPVTDEMIRDYRPNLDRLKKQMVSTRWKFWQRLSSSNIYWQKLKECMDKVQHDKVTVAQSISAQDVLGGTATAITHGINTFDSANIIADVAGKPYKGAGTVSSTVWGAKNVVNSVAKIIGAVKNSDTMTTQQKVGVATDVVFSGGNGLVGSSKYAISAIPGVNKATLGTVSGYIGVTTMGYSVVKGAFQYMDSKAKASLHKDIVRLADRTDALETNQRERDEVENLKVSSKVIHTINKQKARSALFDIGYGSVTLGASVAGLVATGTVATVFSGACAAVVPAALVTANKLSAIEARKVIDSRIYKDKTAKQQTIGAAKELLNAKFSGLSAKLRSKYGERYYDCMNDDASILTFIRKRVVGAFGEVNNKALRNRFISRIGNEAYDRLHANYTKDVEELTGHDIKMGILTKVLVETAGGKINRKELRKSPEEGREKAVKSILTGI